MKKKHIEEKMHPMLHGHHSKGSMEALKEHEGHMMPSKGKKKKKMKKKGMK